MESTRDCQSDQIVASVLFNSKGYAGHTGPDQPDCYFTPTTALPSQLSTQYAKRHELVVLVVPILVNCSNNDSTPCPHTHNSVFGSSPPTGPASPPSRPPW